MMDASQKQDLRFSRLLKLPMYLWSIVFVFVALLYVIGLSFLSRGEIMGVTGEVTRAITRVWLPRTMSRSFCKA